MPSRNQRFCVYLAASLILSPLTLCPLTLTSFAQDVQPLRGRFAFPGKDWGVAFELPGFTMQNVETKPDGRRYMFAKNDTTGILVSITLEQIKPGTRAATCRESLQQKTKSSPAKVTDVHFSRSGDFDVMEYTVPEFAGQHIEQKSLFGCQLYDNTYIDWHVSKVKYVPADQPLFASVVNSLHVSNAQRSSMDLMGEASRLFEQQDYKGAIGPYSQALELENSSPPLGKPLWYVLVDNLGMSYGITGDLQKAKETFDYGVSKDPTYPLFYYNLACTYAEMGDEAKTSDYLRKAFDHKANVLPGESMPDPRTDDSFQKLMQKKEFRELAESLVQSR